MSAPLADGAVQLTDIVVPLDVSVGAPGASGGCGAGVPLTLADQNPFPRRFFARTCTSYSVLLVRPVMVVARRVPP